MEANRPAERLYCEFAASLSAGKCILSLKSRKSKIGRCDLRNFRYGYIGNVQIINRDNNVYKVQSIFTFQTL